MKKERKEDSALLLLPVNNLKDDMFLVLLDRKSDKDEGHVAFEA